MNETSNNISNPGQGEDASMLSNAKIAEIQAVIDSYYWHHGFEFGDGLKTNSVVSAEYTAQFAAALFNSLEIQGKSLLDIGTWTGGYAFAAKALGASRVVATDKFVWNHPHYRGREAFELARGLLGLTVEALETDLDFVSPEIVGVFDVVLFSGVFYHLINPAHILKRISGCARDVLIVETHQDALDVNRPAMILYPGSTLNGDDTNWWGPNPSCMYELLKEIGFSEILYRDTPGYEGRKRGIYQAFRTIEGKNRFIHQKLEDPWISLSDEAARSKLFFGG